MSSSLDPPDPAADPPYKPIPEEKLSLLVKRNDLKAASYHGLRKVSILAMRNPFFKRRRVYVESAVNSTQDRIFYVPFSYIKDRFTLSPTQYVTIDAANASNLVRQNHRFEVSFMGMSVKPHDGLQSNNNELLMYSLSMDTRPAAPVPEAADNTTVRKVRNSSAGDTVMVEDAAGRSELVSLQSLPVTSHPAPTQFAESVDLPFIHYDPVIDGHDSGTEPDQFVPIPSSRRIYKQFKEPIPDSSCIQSVNVRFTVMEIDKISDVQARSIAGVDRLGSYVSKAATGVPYLELLTKAFATASNLGKEGLKKYTRPDHVLSVDTDFLLADSLQADPGDSTDGTDEAGSASEPKVGNYLRVSFIFFYFFYFSSVARIILTLFLIYHAPR